MFTQVQVRVVMKAITVRLPSVREVPGVRGGRPRRAALPVPTIPSGRSDPGRPCHPVNQHITNLFFVFSLYIKNSTVCCVGNVACLCMHNFQH